MRWGLACIKERVRVFLDINPAHPLRPLRFYELTTFAASISRARLVFLQVRFTDNEGQNL